MEGPLGNDPEFDSFLELIDLMVAEKQAIQSHPEVYKNMNDGYTVTEVSSRAKVTITNSVVELTLESLPSFILFELIWLSGRKQHLLLQFYHM